MPQRRHGRKPRAEAVGQVASAKESRQVTYLYLFLDKLGGTIDIQHGMAEPARTEHHGRPVRRLIADNSSRPVLKYDASQSSGWSSQGYAKPENHRHAEMTLGRRLYKPKDDGK
jgi:hypothetical protein